MFSDKLHFYMNKNNMRSPSSEKKKTFFLATPNCYSTFPRPPLLPLLPVDPDHCRVMMYSPAVKGSSSNLVKFSSFEHTRL
jgi:hypothetical protein